MSVLTILKETQGWFLSLQPEFAFLLALPFLVAIAGLLSEFVFHRRRDKTLRR